MRSQLRLQERLRVPQETLRGRKGAASGILLQPEPGAAGYEQASSGEKEAAKVDLL
jgi:hypothetical protein